MKAETKEIIDELSELYQELDNQYKWLKSKKSEVKKRLDSISVLANISVNKTKTLSERYSRETVEKVCDYFDVTISSVYSTTKNGRRPVANITRARRYISWILREHTSIPSTKIGKLYGNGFDHSTVLYHCNSIADDLDFYRKKGKDLNDTVKILTDLGIEIR